jgi:PAS domain S-box-containing protein
MKQEDLMRELERVKNERDALLAENNLLKEEVSVAVKETQLVARIPFESPNPIMRFSYQKQLLFFNSASIPILSYFSPSADKDSFWEKTLNMVIESNQPTELEINARNSWYILSIIPFSEDHYINVYAKDITQLKRIQDIMRYNEEKYRGIFENLDLGILEVDNEQLITKVYPSFTKVTGYTEQDLVGHYASVLLWDDDAAQKTIEENQNRSKGFSGLYELQIKGKNGMPMWLIICGVPIFDIDNKFVGSMGVHFDVTERKRNEQLLEINFQQQKLLSKTAYTLQSPIIVFDEKLNDTLTSLGEFCNVSRVYIFEDSEDGATTTNTYEWCAQNIEPQIQTLQNINYDEIFWVRDSLSEKGEWIVESLSQVEGYARELLEVQDIKSLLIFGLYNEEKKLIGFFGFDECRKERQWDVNEVELLKTVSSLISNEFQRKRYQEGLIKARYQALEAAKAKESFLANMSHEIRTPMNAINGMCNLIAKGDLDSKQKQYLSAVKKSAENLLVIINDILDFSKIEAGKLELETIEFSLRDVINQVVKIQTIKASEKSLLLYHYIDPKLPEVVWGDPYRLNQILLNLISNSIKFTLEGSISLDCKVIATHDDLYTIALEVRDTGIGIDEDKLDSIFETFTQVDSSITRKFGGTGLGLAITQQLVGLHNGGCISVRSKKGIGTTFTIHLDYPKGVKIQIDNDKKRLEQKNMQTNLNGIKVLVAEDNEFNTLLVLSILEEWGINTKTVVNGLLAIDALKNEKFDLILMDVQMPEMGGFEAAQIIRTEMSLSITIIALTANALKGDDLKCIAAGMDDYVSKPFEPEELRTKIIKYIENKKNMQIVNNQENKIQSEGEITYSLDKLSKMSNGNREFLSKMISLFADKTPPLIEELMISAQNNNWERVAQIAHQLKPSFDTFDCASLLKILINLELFYRSDVKDYNDIKNSLLFLDSGTKWLVEKLKNEKNENE